jgi:thiol-disulfide isomerase/thioredoxin
MYPPKEIEPNFKKTIASDLRGYIRVSTQSNRFLIQLFGVIVFSFFTLSAFGQQKVLEKSIVRWINRTKNNEADRNSPVTVIIFLATDCPISQKYMSRIEAIKREYQSTVRFIGIIPGRDPWTKIDSFKEEYGSTLLFLRDPKTKYSRQLGATVTPEVFVLNKDYAIAYQGAIDNWFYALGKNRVQANENYLTDAITYLIKNEPVKVAYRQPIGCLIEYR